MVEYMSIKNNIEIEGKKIAITNLGKTYFPEIDLTKGELIQYYIRMADFILPYLKNRPFSMLHYPDGIHGKTFYQKQRPKNAPVWLKSVNLPSGDKTIDWCMVNDLPSLVYMINRSCIETHAWFSRVPDLGKPDIAIFDLDPSGNTGFNDAAAVALLIKSALDIYKLTAIPKLSGKRGIHIIIPIMPTPYEKVQKFISGICKAIEKINPDRFTMERSIAKRGNRVYLDAVQYSQGKTIPSPYSVRATVQANISVPVTWKELQEGISPSLFTIKTIEQRLANIGDLSAPIYTLKQTLPDILN